MLPMCTIIEGIIDGQTANQKFKIIFKICGYQIFLTVTIQAKIKLLRASICIVTLEVSLHHMRA